MFRSVLIHGALVIATIAFAQSAQAKVIAQSTNGFVVSVESDLKSDPQQAYEKFVAIGTWWDPSHSYSGDGKNMFLDARPGGAWIETLPSGGFVSHMDVTQARPGKSILLSGGLGPLGFMAVSGKLSVTFTAAKAGTHVKWSYAVGGFDQGDFKDISKAVDGVLLLQLQRFTNAANNGTP